MGDGVVVARDGGDPRRYDHVEISLRMVDLAALTSEPSVLGLENRKEGTIMLSFPWEWLILLN